MTQYPLIVFPDAVDVLCQAVTDGLDGAGSSAIAYDAPPSPRPAEFVTIRRTGGPRKNKTHDDAQITVECWGETTEAACDLAQLTRGVMHQLTGSVVGSVTIGRVVEASGPADLPDPLSDQARFTQTFMVVLRGSTPD